MQFIPPIGTTGIWSLASPFSAKLLPSIPYTCIAIRKLSDITAAGGDPETDYYTVNSIDHIRFNSDLSAGVSILSLQGGSNSIIYVPSSFINNYPDIGGVPYTVLALAINIGAIPDTLDLSYLKQRIVSVISETIGVDASVNTIAVSAKALLTNADASVVETARQLKIGTVVTDYAKYLSAITERDNARAKIVELEAFILSARAAGKI